jgi:hypothetical protein
VVAPAALSRLVQQLGELLAEPAAIAAALLVPVVLIGLADWRIRRRR